MTTTKLIAGQTYDLDTLVFAGWSNGQDHIEGYNYLDWFRGGVYQGPDEDGVEPVMAANDLTGARVEAGEGDDHDTGTVDSVADGMATVRWDSGVVTPCPVEMLRRR